MFQTFTGSSRKVRNVNLSGQKPKNPFTGSSSWTPAVEAAGASKTVAHAQAERLQRQQERSRLKAAQCIQRTIDQLYAATGLVDPGQRAAEAAPLVLGVYQSSNAEDQQRLCWLARDLLQSRFSAFAQGAIEPPRLSKLARIVVSGLCQLDPNIAPPQVKILLAAIVEITTARPQAVQPVLGEYYSVLGRYCRILGPTSELASSVRSAVCAPLTAENAPDSFIQTAYGEFATSFLTQPDISLFESDVGSFGANVDVDRLSVSLDARRIETSGSQADLMWLLAHFIVLQKTRRQLALHSHSLRVLYSLLSVLSNQIREAFPASDLKPSSAASEIEEGVQPMLPPYVSSHLASLTDKDEITGVLEKFTSERGATSSSELEDVGLLAGYILILIYCFPAHGDEIRMRLYLADIPTAQGPLPAIKFFWNALSRTSIFSRIASDADAALSILRQRPSSDANSPWHREWRTILLFLELYVFILRLTDDDDFFSVLKVPMSIEASGSRLRSSGLNLQELKRFTLFLKHLGFTLYYNAADLLTAAPDPPTTLNAATESSARFKSAAGNSRVGGAPSLALTAGVGLDALRSMVTTATRMLYERDSRRPFLPQNHWLMTAKLNMDEFLTAVVLEEQRQREQGEPEDDDEDDGQDAEELPTGLPSAGSRLSRQAQLARNSVLQKRAARDNLRALSGPRLEILRNMPFVIPFDVRVQIFRQFVHLDKHWRRGGNIDPDRWRLWVLNQHGGPFEPSPSAANILGKHQAQIQRGRVFRDALESFWDLKEGLKEPIQITFVDEFGMTEAGIDGGGVTKEFLTSVTTEAFAPERRLFVANSKNAYYPNPSDMDQLKHYLREAHVAEGSEEWTEAIVYRLREYEFLGRIIGKCMYEGILIDIVFAGFFLLKWASPAGAPDTYRANINDLRELDEELYQGMLRLKNYPGDVRDLSLDFTITDQISRPSEPVRTVTRNLVPDGENVAVTNENRLHYIIRVAHHRLVVQPYAQTRAFLRGLGTIIDPAWLSMFNQSELQRLVGGDSSEIDVEDMRRHTVYSGAYSIGDDGQEHPTVRLFWEVMHGLEDRERRDVLNIRDGGLDQDRLPSASTCVNLLKLPQYTSAAVLKRKLLYAVTSGAGFDLS
ncbi:83e2b5bb-b7cd-4b81-b9d5-e27a3a1c63a3 [Thermothielavioides terrestris]|uniref:HECT-type E3 ubiquitin transferase n=1 Tax=Thermothielavioides terrestris TaxID=2587410 RepID=A0A446BWP5_9PEZI|nr:83e2b5bb-b7cd-4b81-b9d5-e27a3a1c63a3 [Thermothielavioides terrestris]